MAAVLELERHTSLGAHIAAVLAQCMTHFSHGAHLVIGHGVDHDGDATNAVTLVADFFVMHAFEVAGGFVDIAFDVVCRHIGGFGFFNR